MKSFPYLVFLFSVLLFASCEPKEVAPTVTAPAEKPVVENTAVNAEKDNYDGTQRVVWQRPDMIISLLGNGDISNKTVVDIGAGKGFFSKRLAPVAEKVIALDIDQSFLDLIDSTKVLELAEEHQDRLETRLTPRDAPNLQDDEADAVLIVNTFMFIENKLEYLQKLKQAIKKGGRLVIVDFKRKRTEIGPQPREHRAPLYMVEDLLYEAGYTNIQAKDTELNYQYILVADK